MGGAARAGARRAQAAVAGRAREAGVTAANGRRGRILVIDDSELVLEITKDALEEAGFEVHVNSSWVEVNAAIREHRPDLILLDLVMPSIRGESLCEILKKSSFGRDIPIIIFSTKEEPEIKRLAEEAGAEGYIVKRMNKKDIVDSVSYFFDKFCRR